MEPGLAFFALGMVALAVILALVLVAGKMMRRRRRW
jgi:DMSO/TMAO reductase YedYZ heme-binding membrane subunit